MNKELKNGIMLGLSVLFILLIVYLCTAVLLTGEIGGEKEDKTTTTTNASTTAAYSNMILAGQSFDRKEDKYMVVFFSDSKASDDLKSAVSSYDSTTKGVKLYVVNLDEAVNNYVVSDTFNSNAEKAADLKIMNQAIITISGGKMESYLILEDDIIDTLK